MTGEMTKFRFLLDQKKIQWIDASDPEDSGSRFLNVDRTWLWYKGKRWSVVHGFGTYGGRSRTYKDEGGYGSIRRGSSRLANSRTSDETHRGE